MRLIDADKCIEHIESSLHYYRHELIQKGLLRATEYIKCAITIDPIKYGHWISYSTLTSFLRCNQCHNGIHWDDNKKPNYCPNCGAKMIKENQ